MFNYVPLANKMKEYGENTENVASILKVSLDDLKQTLNQNKFLTMSQLHRLCEHYNCSPSDIMAFTPDNDLIKLDWDKVASFGKPTTVLSAECGLSRSAFCNAKNTTGKVKLENAKKIADILGCAVEDLV